jgi:hypothetical protein
MPRLSRLPTTRWATFLARLALAAVVALASSGMAACTRPPGDLDATVQRASAGYRFGFLSWEVRHLLGKGRMSREGARLAAAAPDPAALVEEYLDLYGVVAVERARVRRAEAEGNLPPGDLAALRGKVAELESRLQALSDPVETHLAGQIRAVLTELGIHNPADRWLSLGIGFPPVWFELTQPPHVLVVSPRSEIRKVREVMLIPELTVAEMRDMEAEVDALGYSTLVVQVGGFGGLYPSLVAETSSLSFLVEAAAEEWLHQYLAFTPLGFSYVLDLLNIRRSYEVATLNETLAGIVSAEVGRQVLAAYYLEYLPAAEEEQPAEQEEEPGGFSFSREMRAIRLRVDDLLAAGRIEEAEAYMEERRQYLETQGYYIRKLNQAYFAFHGTYAAEPTSVDPIGEEVRLLRERSATLSGFLNQMAGVTSRASLRVLLGLTP